MSPETRARIEADIKNHPIVLFMKGNALFPQCGFSAAAVEILKSHGRPVHTVDVLTEPGVREGIKEFSNWPTIPQVYIHGQFVGGSDILRDLHDSGELEKLLGAGAR